MSGAMRLAMVVVTVVTLAANGPWPTVNGQLSTVEEEGPIVGPGPCSSDTPWGCYRFQVWLPVMMAE